LILNIKNRQTAKYTTRALFELPTCTGRNFLNIAPILMKPVPMESSHSGLSIRAGFSKIKELMGR